MTKICFIIGNGFDLACGMKSSYQDIFSKYCEDKGNDILVKGLGSELKQWKDFEYEMVHNTPDFSSEEQYLNAIQEFREYIEDYLAKEQERQFTNLIACNSKNCIEETARSLLKFQEAFPEKLRNKISEIYSGMDAEFRFISFNYTTLLDRLILLFTTKYAATEYNNIWHDVIHIHGKLDDNPRTIILGADNIKQFSLRNFEVSDEIRMHFEKPFFNAEYNQPIVQEAEKAIQECDILCVYGKSIGETDETWNKEIKSWVEKNDKHYLIFFDYDFTSLKLEYSGDELKLRKNAIKNIGEQLEIDKNRIDQIFAPVGWDVFNYDGFIDGKVFDDDEVIRMGIYE